jgi:hypothetical protein
VCFEFSWILRSGALVSVSHIWVGLIKSELSQQEGKNAQVSTQVF